jgi:hypothetical protein
MGRAKDRNVDNRAASLRRADKILKLVALGADLGGQLVFVLEPSRANHARFLDAVGQGFLTIDVFAAVHGPVGGEGVRMVGRAAEHGIYVLLLKAFAPIHILRGLGEFFRAESQMLLVDIAERNNVLLGKHVEMRFRTAPSAQQCDV